MVQLGFETRHTGLRNITIINASKYALNTKNAHLQGASRIGGNMVFSINACLLTLAKGMLKPLKIHLQAICSRGFNKIITILLCSASLTESKQLVNTDHTSKETVLFFFFSTLTLGVEPFMYFQQR